MTDPETPFIHVDFVHPDGTIERHPATIGTSLMDCAVDNGVETIHGQCGGGCTCSTCHAAIHDDWWAQIGGPVGDEAEILEYVPERVHTSRLLCQVPVETSMDGLRVILIEPVPIQD